MMINIWHSISWIDWSLLFISAFCIGLGKAGLKGIDMISIILMALIFGGKTSTGVVLPLLSVGDIVAVYMYNRHAHWSHFWKLIPWIIVGILIGVVFGKEMNEQLFRQIMVGIIFFTFSMIYITELSSFRWKMPEGKSFAAGTGLAAGFATMIGNLAGVFANLYFIAMRLPKHDFIGTTAWLFLFINLFKFPFQFFYWGNISSTSLLTDLFLIPAVGLGFWIGFILVRRISETSYRKLVILLTLSGSILMLLKK